MRILGDQAVIYLFIVIIHWDVLINIRLLVFIIGKLCSRLSRVESKFGEDLSYFVILHYKLRDFIKIYDDYVNVPI